MLVLQTMVIIVSILLKYFYFLLIKFIHFLATCTWIYVSLVGCTQPFVTVKDCDKPFMPNLVTFDSNTESTWRINCNRPAANEKHRPLGTNTAYPYLTEKLICKNYTSINTFADFFLISDFIAYDKYTRTTYLNIYLEMFESEAFILLSPVAHTTDAYFRIVLKAGSMYFL